MLKGGNTRFGKQAVKKNIANSDYYSNINTSVALGKHHVPIKHKQLAANYVLIKKIFGACAAAIPITNSDKATLARHGFQQLEYASIEQVNRQIEQLKDWSNSGDILLSAYANEIFEIRIKELKFMRLTMNTASSVEFADGWTALEKYVEYIAR